MRFPFTREEFLGVFRSYNDAIGIAPLLLLVLAAAVVALANSQRPWRHRAIFAALAALWLWSGAVYHWGFFARINAAALLFAVLFGLQSMVLVVMGVLRGRWQFNPRHSPTALIGWILIAYSMVVYPLLGWSLGHGYPGGPSFGTPCPTTLFFFGMTFWISDRIPLAAVVIPVIWAVIGSAAVLRLGMYEDFALAFGAFVVIAEVIRQRMSGNRRVVPPPNGSVPGSGQPAIPVLPGSSTS